MLPKPKVVIWTVSLQDNKIIMQLLSETISVVPVCAQEGKESVVRDEEQESQRVCRKDSGKEV
jgi:ABC-type hemin transport system substrate-binding protein